MTYYGLHNGKWFNLGEYKSLSSAKRGNSYFDQIANQDEMYAIPSVKVSLAIEYSMLLAIVGGIIVTCIVFLR